MGCGGSCNIVFVVDDGMKKDVASSETLIPCKKGVGSGDIITIGVGNFGTNAAYSFIQEIAYEHGILKGKESLCREPTLEFASKYFSEPTKGNYTSRSILVDHSNSFLNEVKNLPQKVFHCENILNNMSPSNLLADTYYLEPVEDVLERIRQESEKCSSLAGFIFFADSTEGVGSGKTSIIIEKLNDDFGKTMKVHNNVFRNPETLTQETSFNSCLSLNGLYQSSLNLLHSFDALKTLAQEYKFSGSSIESAFLGRVFADLTAASRFSGSNDFSLPKIIKELSPYPCIRNATIHYYSSNNENDCLEKAFDMKTNLGGLKNAETIVASTVFLRGNFNEANSLDYFYKKHNSKEVTVAQWYVPGICRINTCNIDGKTNKYTAVRLTNSTNWNPILDYMMNKYFLLFTVGEDYTYYSKARLDKEKMSGFIESVYGNFKDYEEVACSIEEEGCEEGK